MNLNLVKKADFNGVECDFYETNETKNIWLTREQIGRALEYEHPGAAIKNIHLRNKGRIDQFSRVAQVELPQGGEQNIYLYSPKGVYEICRWSRQPKADAFMDWVWGIVEQLRTGRGYDMAAVITETVKVTLTEFTKQLIPLLKEILTDVKTAPVSEVHIHQKEDRFVPRRRKHHSIIEHLDDDVRKEVEFMICSDKYSFRDIVEMLREYGVDVSITSVYRYSKRLVDGL
ncbi:MAG: BRO family protein [Burkholderiales bacterium]